MQHTRMFETLFDNVRHEIVSEPLRGPEPEPIDQASPQSQGSERPSVSAKIIRNTDKSGLSNREMAWTVGTL